MNPEDFIQTVFVGLGDYGRELGEILSRNWRSIHPLSICAPASGERVDIESFFRNKDLIFIGCDSPEQANSLASIIRELATPYLVLILHPRQHLDGTPDDTRDFGRLSTPQTAEFPAGWDPVSALFGSLVNPGIIGVDLADLKSVAHQKSGAVHVLQTEETLTPSRLDSWLSRINPGKSSGLYVIMEHRDDAELSVAQIDAFAETIHAFTDSETEIFYTAPFYAGPCPMSITLIMFQG